MRDAFDADEDGWKAQMLSQALAGLDQAMTGLRVS